MSGWKDVSSWRREAEWKLVVFASLASHYVSIHKQAFCVKPSNTLSRHARCQISEIIRYEMSGREDKNKHNPLEC